MANKCNFIVTRDKKITERMLSSGFQIVSHIGDVYTFLNQPPKNFSFTDVDKTKVVYTNSLNV